MTNSQTKESIQDCIHQSNLIEGYDSADYDKQSLLAWKRLQPLKSLTHYDIIKTQKIITLLQDDIAPDQRGYYRKVNVRVGNYIAPNHTMVTILMDNWLNDCKTLEPMEAHIRFEKIHPFIDGNGRTGRMLMWWHEVKLGLQPTLIKNSEKQDYYKELL